jgi:hypothetical protein
MPDDQFPVAGACVVLAREAPLGKTGKQDLSGGPDRVAVTHVPPEHAALFVGDRHVKVCPVPRQRAGQAQDLELTVERCLARSRGLYAPQGPSCAGSRARSSSALARESGTVM